MSTENINIPKRRSGTSFSKREKAYHVYMYTLQKRNYGISMREYVRQHNLILSTFEGWIKYYPEGKPYYDIDNPVTAETPVREEAQMVKLSSNQLVPRKDNEVTNIRRDFSSSAVMIKFYDSVISADSTNLSFILSAIKNVSSGQDQ